MHAGKFFRDLHACMLGKCICICMLVPRFQIWINPTLPSSQMIKMVCFPLVPGSQVVKAGAFPIFPGSQVINLELFPIFPGALVPNPSNP